MIAITGKTGQLANRLFVFANFLGFAMEYDIRLMNPGFSEFASEFSGTSEDVLSRWPRRRSLIPQTSFVRRIVEWSFRRTTSVAARVARHNRFVSVIRLDWSDIMDLDIPQFRIEAQEKLVLVDGWLFDAQRAIEEHASAIRDFFTPIPRIRQLVDRRLTKYREDCDLLVGLHLRRGDYRNFLGGKYFYDSSQYEAIMHRVVQAFPDRKVRFLVCSNEPTGAIHFGNTLDYVFSTGTAIEDLYGLARCDLLVGPPSTYSMWASFHGEVPLLMMEHASQEVSRTAFRVYHSQMEFPEVLRIRAGEIQDFK